MSEFISPLNFTDEGFTLDLSASMLTHGNVRQLQPELEKAHQEMMALEQGAIKNPDEHRQVTHFTDRLTYEQSAVYKEIEVFFTDLSQGKITGTTGLPLGAVIFNGIGGSALGPQLAQMALNGPYWNELTPPQRRHYPRIYFVDNTDPAGLVDILAVIDPAQTLLVTISKSGGTQETKNNARTLEKLYREQYHLDFAHHAAAITMTGSELDREAREMNWLAIWPMADSIGGRTSITAVVGHAPAAAGGIDFSSFLDGARKMDEWTREPETVKNPAYLLAILWYVMGNGKGDKNMVILPYSDRLVLLSRYLQQLVMESLGKEFDLRSRPVYQGLSVFGNKGGTDAHAFVQQLHDGRNDFFVTFIEILEDSRQFLLDRNLTMGDYLHNFRQGLANALSVRKRSVSTITLERLTPRTLGMIIALFERAVAFYAELIGINAFHQPGVQAYKKAADKLNELNLKLQNFVATHPGFSGAACDYAAALDSKNGNPDDIAGILAKFTLNQRVFNSHRLTRRLVDGEWHYTIS